MKAHTYIRVESQLADVAGDDLFPFGHHGYPKGVVYDSFLHRVHLDKTRAVLEVGCAVILSSVAVTTHTHSCTVLKFGKSPTGDVASTENGRNGFIITEGPVAPMSPGADTAPPLPAGNRNRLLTNLVWIGGNRNLEKCFLLLVLNLFSI